MVIKAAQGILYIGGNSGGVPDAIVDGVTGSLIEPDSPQAWADAICAMLDKPEEAKCKAKPLSVSEVIAHMVTVQVSID